MNAPGGIGHNSRESGSVNAVTFGLDTARLEELYEGSSWRNGYREIGGILREHGFDWQQGSVCFGGDSVNAVTCVLAIQDVSKRLDWFSASVRDVRMLRIEEFNDLGPAIGQVIQ